MHSFRMLAVLTVITGIAYPFLVTVIGAVAFPEMAGGSLIREGDRVRGSSLLGQPFSADRYFQGRPSATSPMPYNAASSSGSNQGPTNPALAQAVADRVKALRDAGHDTAKRVPVDLVTASASGLDPHISPAAAEYQVARVAKARAMTEDHVRGLVARRTEGRTFAILGEPRVNVLLLNLDLDGAAPR
jgi:K+-transporting ATPase ATPase C chain